MADLTPAPTAPKRSLPPWLDRATILMGLMFAAALIWMGLAKRTVETFTPPVEDASNKVMLRAGLMSITGAVTQAKSREMQIDELLDSVNTGTKFPPIPFDKLGGDPFLAPLVEKTPVAVTSNKNHVVQKPPVDVKPPVLVLQAVSFGTNPSATISGVLVRQSQLFPGTLWRVTTIRAESVILEYRDQSMTLLLR